jgi:hypothetical protein
MDEERIWRLRDAAIRVLHGYGQWEMLGGLRLLTADWRDLKIVYRTPFQRKRPCADPLTYASALALAQAEPDLAYMLEIWHWRGAQWYQVLHTQWSEDNAERRVLTYRFGEWELSLMVLAPP